MIDAFEIRVLAYLVAACLLVWLGSHFTGLHYKTLIAQEDAARADMAEVAALRAKDKEDAANTRNAETVAGLQTQLDAVSAERAALAGRLQNALKASRSGVPQARGDTPVAPAPVPSGDGQLIGLLAAEIDECRQNELRYGALIGEIRPQL